HAAGADMARMTTEAAEPRLALPGREAIPLSALFWKVAPAVSVVGLFALWQALVSAGVFNPYLLPPVPTVVGRVISDVVTGEFFLNAAHTLYRAIAGFSIAAALAIVIGVSMARVRAVRWFFDPILSVGFPMPKVAFLPVFMLWFGAYDASKILLIAFASFFAIAVNTVAGTQGVDRHLIWSARSLGASDRKTLWTVILPAALPQILTGLQIAMPLAMIVTIVTEMLMGGVGLGGAMIRAQRFADSIGVFSGIIQIGFTGFLVIFGLRWLRRQLLPWHEEAKH
ncbi:MAG TPA: ABC transporter permease, partial [Xanthobacteraceae bacterium]|nr:ABC transporter permease [Xanthobacteraceae bacterium]